MNMSDISTVFDGLLWIGGLSAAVGAVAYGTVMFAQFVNGKGFSDFAEHWKERVEKSPLEAYNYVACASSEDNMRYSKHIQQQALELKPQIEEIIYQKAVSGKYTGSKKEFLNFLNS